MVCCYHLIIILASLGSARCDQCQKWHHFACLDPPAKKSPKPRGYLWYCDACEAGHVTEQSPITNNSTVTASPSATVNHDVPLASADGNLAQVAGPITKP